eukprot:4603626-Amphidinium_carterae.1
MEERQGSPYPTKWQESVDSALWSSAQSEPSKFNKQRYMGATAIVCIVIKLKSKLRPELPWLHTEARCLNRDSQIYV